MGILTTLIALVVILGLVIALGKMNDSIEQRRGENYEKGRQRQRERKK